MSRQASPSPEEKAAHYSLEGLHQDWDGVAEVRKRLRNRDRVFKHYDPETGKLCNVYVEKTLNNVRCNRLCLQPLFRRMKQNDLHLPMIDGVIEEMRSLYCCAKISVSYDILYQEAWACRRLLSLAKNTILHRKYLSEDCFCRFCFLTLYLCACMHVSL